MFAGTPRNGLILHSVGLSILLVVGLSSALDEARLIDFYQRTGFRVSLFTPGRPLAAVAERGEGAADAARYSTVYRDVLSTGCAQHTKEDMGAGRSVPITSPLAGLEETPAGVLSIAPPTSAIMGDIRAALIVALPAVLAITLAGALLACALANGVRRPVLDLATAAARLRDGDR